MEDQRARHALARIERAVARIEASAAHEGDSADAAELEALRTAHGRLRGQVERAISDLDSLLASRAGGAG